MNIFGYKVNIAKYIILLLIGLCLGLCYQLGQSETALKKATAKTDEQAQQQMIEGVPEAEWYRKQLLTKHALYARTKKSLEENVNYATKLAAYCNVDKKIHFEIQACTCPGACPRWKPNGKYSDCGIPTCPICSRPDPEEPKKDAESK